MKVYQIYFMLLGFFLGGSVGYGESNPQKEGIKWDPFASFKSADSYQKFDFNPKLEKCLSFEGYQRIRELMEDRRHSHSCGVEGRDCRLWRTEEVCFHEKVNACPNSEDGVWGKFQKKSTMAFIRHDNSRNPHSTRIATGRRASL